MSRVVSFFHDVEEEAFELQQIFNAVVNDNVEDLKGKLFKKVGLLSKKGEVTDDQGRTFECISPFQLAIWYLNDELLKVMINILYAEKDDELIEALVTQMNSILFNGIKYQSEEGKVINSTYYHYERVIKIYHTLCPHGEKNFLDVIGAEGTIVPINLVKDLSQMSYPWDKRKLDSFFEDKIKTVYLLKENLQGLFTAPETSV